MLEAQKQGITCHFAYATALQKPFCGHCGAALTSQQLLLGQCACIMTAQHLALAPAHLKSNLAALLLKMYNSDKRCLPSPLYCRVQDRADCSTQ